MQEIRIHGRGGQGGVTSAELLARGAINKDKHGQAFPSFGPERRGAPVQAFVRVSDREIRLREKIYEPDIVMVLDPSLLEIANVADGLKQDGLVVINSHDCAEKIKKKYDFPRVARVDATNIAIEELGVPITNTTMLGALLSASGILQVADMENVVMERFGSKLGPKNFQAMNRAFAETENA